ncbi:MAG: 30S ribosomal protein S4 [Candidatus Aenigmatarchaeota archaeon]
MRRFRKKYKRPQMLWDRARIDREKVLKKTYGLTRKQEIWKAETLLRKYRRMARNLAATKDKQAERSLMTKLVNLGMLDKGAGLDDVLGMTVENVLGRRLQTIVLKRGLALTPTQARQLIVHGHVKLGNRKVPHPSRLVSKDDEARIEVMIDVKRPATAAEEKPTEAAPDGPAAAAEG